MVTHAWPPGLPSGPGAISSPDFSVPLVSLNRAQVCLSARHGPRGERGRQPREPRLLARAVPRGCCAVSAPSLACRSDPLEETEARKEGGHAGEGERPQFKPTQAVPVRSWHLSLALHLELLHVQGPGPAVPFLRERVSHPALLEPSRGEPRSLSPPSMPQDQVASLSRPSVVSRLAVSETNPHEHSYLIRRRRQKQALEKRQPLQGMVMGRLELHR